MNLFYHSLRILYNCVLTQWKICTCFTELSNKVLKKNKKKHGWGTWLRGGGAGLHVACQFQEMLMCRVYVPYLCPRCVSNLEIAMLHVTNL